MTNNFILLEKKNKALLIKLSDIELEDLRSNLKFTIDLLVLVR